MYALSGSHCVLPDRSAAVNHDSPPHSVAWLETSLHSLPVEERAKSTKASMHSMCAAACSEGCGGELGIMFSKR